MPSLQSAALLALILCACSNPTAQVGREEQGAQETPGGWAGAKVVKTNREWRELLSPMAYKVTRRAGTERAFSGSYWDTTTPGTYHCVCCQTALFRSDSKFESHCGWPSFFEPLEGSRLEERTDGTLGMRRIEVICRTCDAHLGHVFPDGPPPTGLRYCINSAALVLAEDDR